MKFEDLEVWKRSSRLCVALYKALSDCRDYGFKDQITRSALSVPSNIAEGYEREGEKERANFLSYAKGSCGELRTQIYIGIEISYLNKEEAKMDTRDQRDLLNASRTQKNAVSSKLIAPSSKLPAPSSQLAACSSHLGWVACSLQLAACSSHLGWVACSSQLVACSSHLGWVACSSHLGRAE